MSGITVEEGTRRGWLATRWLHLALAATFLTRLPLPIRHEVTPDDLRASMGWYPLIGLALGAVGWGAYQVGLLLLPATVAAAMVIIVLEVLTGALHLDGVMDTCDGIGSGAPRERALEIMKDSRVGAMGVFGALAVVLLKVLALGSLLPGQAMVPLLVGWAAARAVPACSVTLFPYARATGTGGAFARGAAPGVAMYAVLIALALAYLCGMYGGLALAGGAILLVLFVQAGVSRRLGGLTGDVYGLGIELAEVLALVGGCLLVKLAGA